MDFGTPPGNASYGMDFSYDGVLWKADWDWHYQFSGGMGAIVLPDSDVPHTLPETVRNAGCDEIRETADVSGDSRGVVHGRVVAGRHGRDGALGSSAARASIAGMDEDVHAEAQELRAEIQQLRDEVRAAREDHLERIEALEREVLPGTPGDEVGLP
jgi:hypothetical protein